MVESLTMEGIDGTLALRQAGFDPSALLTRQRWVPLDAWDRLLVQAQALAPDPGYGMRNGACPAWFRMSPFSMLAMHAPSLRHILRDFMRFHPLLSDRLEVELVEGRGSAWLRIDPLAHDPQARMFRAEAVAMGMVLLVRLVGARADEIIRVTFSHPEPAHAAQCAEVLGVPVVFGAPELTVQFAPRLLDIALPGRDLALYAVIRGRAETSLASLRGPHGDIAQALRDMLIAALPRTPDLAGAAAHLGISERSLRRELHRQDLTYSRLLQECQQVFAEQLVACGDLSFEQVAQAVGFTSTAAFFRAFRRWTGLTPNGWRAHQRVAAGQCEPKTALEQAAVVLPSD